MPRHGPIVITSAVEGIVDEAVIRRLIRDVGGEPGTVYGKNGKSQLRRSINGYNNAARFKPWIVLVDLDNEADCAPPVRFNWLNAPAPFMCFRIAVREVEAWLLADRDNLASFLGVSISAIPVDVEIHENPKQMMVNLARRSRRRVIREDMVPRPGGGRAIGPAYASRLIEFAEQSWEPRSAAARCDSLDRSLRCLATLVREYSRAFQQ